ncbi:unnamed protein product [Soboliphyme baturini]|uniref:BRO1 domain-containing protein n=1 Tax=Soboliphyme baturini TaxID=241478 RepID=A0A3P8AZH9_9BILA|nr:unnamed protein product [Soboliphyme baturini]
MFEQEPRDLLKFRLEKHSDTPLPVFVADVRFEMACILHNIGALHSYLGSLDNRISSEGMKASCTHFQCAAWSFERLAEQYGIFAKYSRDFEPHILNWFSQIMLAQAQECILEKSLIDTRKNLIVAKIAFEIAELYRKCADAMDSPAMVETVGGSPFKNWKKFMLIKLSYYMAITHLYRGMQSDEERKMGERLTFYTAAKTNIADASKMLQSIGSVDQTSAGQAISFVRDVVIAKYDNAKKENDFVYHELTPTLESMPVLKGALLVKPLGFDTHDKDVSGPEIFSRLIPLEIHNLSSLYSEEKAKLLREVTEKVEKKDHELKEFCAAIDIEGFLKSLETDVSLPEQLVTACAALKAEPQDVSNFKSSLEKLADRCSFVESSLREIEQELATGKATIFGLKKRSSETTVTSGIDGTLKLLSEQLQSRRAFANSLIDSFEAFKDMKQKCKDGVTFYEMLQQRLFELKASISKLCEDSFREVAARSTSAQVSAIHPQSYPSTSQSCVAGPSSLMAGNAYPFDDRAPPYFLSGFPDQERFHPQTSVVSAGAAVASQYVTPSTETVTGRTSVGASVSTEAFVSCNPAVGIPSQVHPYPPYSLYVGGFNARQQFTPAGYRATFPIPSENVMAVAALGSVSSTAPFPTVSYQPCVRPGQTVSTYNSSFLLPTQSVGVTDVPNSFLSSPSRPPMSHQAYTSRSIPYGSMSVEPVTGIMSQCRTPPQADRRGPLNIMSCYSEANVQNPPHSVYGYEQNRFIGGAVSHGTGDLAPGTFITAPIPAAVASDQSYAVPAQFIPAPNQPYYGEPVSYVHPRLVSLFGQAGSSNDGGGGTVPQLDEITKLSDFSPIFILTQAPTPHTLADFWLMVYEQHIGVICALLAENETKQSRYVTLLRFAYTTFRSSGVCDDIDLFIQFVSVSRGHLKALSSDLPVCVLTLLGDGMNCIFAVLLSAIEELTQAGRISNFLHLFEALHKYQKTCLSNENQLYFTYEAILQFIKGFLAKGMRLHQLTEA